MLEGIWKYLFINTVIKIFGDKTVKKNFIYFNHFAWNIFILANFNYIQIVYYFLYFELATPSWQLQAY